MKNRFEERWEKPKKNTEDFVGRNKYIDLFKELYSTLNTRDATVLNFFGVGGIGKTTIVKHIEKTAKTQNIPIFYYDLAKHSSIISFYEKLYIWFQENRIKATYFQMAFLVYWQRVYPNIEFKESLPVAIKESGLFSDIASLVFENSLDLVKDSIPIVGGVSKFLYQGYKKISTRLQLDNEVVDSIGEMSDSNIEIEEIEGRLPYFLMHDLKLLKDSNEKVPIFILDTYEKLYESLSQDKRNIAESWIENFAASIQQQGMLIIAGREKIEWNRFYPIWDNLIKYARVDELSIQETKEITKIHNITNEEVVEAIAQASKGYPFYIQLAIDAYKLSPENFNAQKFKNIGLKEIFKRFVGNLKNEDLTILEYLSITRIFDKNLYKFIMAKANIAYSNIVFKYITSYSFFLQNGSNYIMHELMRESFLQQIDKQQQKNIHKIIFDYYEEILLKQEENILDSFILKETLYHLLQFAAEEEISNWFSFARKKLFKIGEYSLLVDLYENAADSIKSNENKAKFLIEKGLICIDIENNEILKNTIEQLENMVVPTYLLDDVLYLKIQKDIYYTEHKIEAKKRMKKLDFLSKKIEKVIIKSDTLDLKVRAYIELANILRKNKRYDEAQSYLYMALNMAQDNLLKAKIYDKFGYLHRDRKKYLEAKEYFLLAINLKKEIFSSGHIEIAKSYHGLSQILMKQQKVDDACLIKKDIVASFEKIYGKYSARVKNEYKIFARYKDASYIKSIGLDLELYYLSKLEFAIQNNNSNEILQKLNNLKTEAFERHLQIAMLLAKTDEEKADYYFEKALAISESQIKKRQVYHFYYISYRKYGNLNKANNALLQILSISKKLDTEMYISDLQRAAYFYYKFMNSKDKASDTYVIAEETLLQTKSKKRKLAEIYSYHAKLYNIKDPKRVEYLYKAFDILKEINIYSELMKSIDEISKVLISNSRVEESLNMLNYKLQVAKSVNDFARMDSTYGQIADIIYKKQKRIDKELECYQRQISLRKKLGDTDKLAKGYKYLAEFIFDKYKDNQKAEEYFRKGLNILLNENKINYEVAGIYTYAMLQFFYKCDNLEKAKEIIDLRVKLAKNSNILNVKYLALLNLSHYYYIIGQIDLAIETIKKILSFITVNKHPDKRAEILEKALNYTNYSKYIDSQMNFLLELYEAYLFLKEYKKAEKIFYKLIKKKQECKNLQDFEAKYRGLFGNLLNQRKYRQYAYAFADFKKYNQKEYIRFIYDQIKRAKKRAQGDSSLFYKIYTQLKEFNAEDEASYFFNTYFDLKLIELKGKFDAQKEHYEKAKPIFLKINNSKFKNDFFKRYKRFKKRIQNMLIINGVVVSKILKNVLLSCKNLQDLQKCTSDTQKLKEFIHQCSLDQNFMQYVQDRKTNLSVFLQGASVIIPKFNSLNFGFETNALLFSWLFNNSSFKLVKKMNGSDYKVILSESSLDGYEEVSEINNYEKFVHNSTNYAILLSKAFFEGNGIFFSKNNELQEKVLNFIANTTINNMTFIEILNLLYEQCKINDNIDSLRAENIVKSLYYADLFLVNHTFEDFENRLLTKKFSGQDIMNRLKDFGYKRLQELIGEINEAEYNALWV